MSLTLGDTAYEEAHINQDISYQLIVTEVVFSVIALAGMRIRLWVKLTKAQKPFGFDDILVLGAFLLAVGLVIVSCLSKLPSFLVGRLSSCLDFETHFMILFSHQTWCGKTHYRRFRKRPEGLLQGMDGFPHSLSGKPRS